MYENNEIIPVSVANSKMIFSQAASGQPKEKLFWAHMALLRESFNESAKTGWYAAWRCARAFRAGALYGEEEGKERFSNADEMTLAMIEAGADCADELLELGQEIWKEAKPIISKIVIELLKEAILLIFKK